MPSFVGRFSSVDSNAYATAIVVPAALLFGLGALAALDAMAFWPTVLASALGAIAGDIEIVGGASSGGG